MSTPRQPPRQVPTLTEVVDVNAHRGTAAPNPSLDAPPAPMTEDELTRRVLVDLHQHIDQMLEQRLRATLEPALVQLATVMVCDIRDQLVETLHAMVKQAVAQELARHEGP